MKGVDSNFLLDAVAASLVAPGVQIFLHGFADGEVFRLSLMTELHRAQCIGTAEQFRQNVPLENRHRALGRERADHIDLDVVGIAVEHPVGEDPEVVGRETVRCGRVHSGSFIVVRSADELAVEIVSPAVITAAEKPARPAASGRWTGTMPADVIETVQLDGCRSSDEQRLAGKFSGKKIASFGDLIVMSDELPISGE